MVSTGLELVLNDILEPARVEIVLKDNRYDLAGFDEFEAGVARAKKLIDTYDYTDDDRSLFRDTKTLVSHFKTDLNKAIKAEQTEAFGLVEERRKHVAHELDSIMNLLKVRLDESDARARAEKLAVFKKEFDQLAIYWPVLSDFEANEFIETKWLNRSSNVSKLLVTFNDRIESFKNICEEELIRDTPRIVLDWLQKYNWNGTKAIVEYRKCAEETERARREAEERKAELERIRVEREALAEDRAKAREDERAARSALVEVELAKKKAEEKLRLTEALLNTGNKELDDAVNSLAVLLAEGDYSGKSRKYVIELSGVQFDILEPIVIGLGSNMNLR